MQSIVNRPILLSIISTRFLLKAVQLMTVIIFVFEDKTLFLNLEMKTRLNLLVFMYWLISVLHRRAQCKILLFLFTWSEYTCNFKCSVYLLSCSYKYLFHFFNITDMSNSKQKWFTSNFEITSIYQFRSIRWNHHFNLGTDIRDFHK